ncbi:stage III sporulation protein AF [Clostridium coskatii]|uniref:Stage III sporulation protein AF n=1 Tax=Clostridium coskatii TaxID=1705578 RepID=A0A162LDT8_9CLOT|nr:stage III sporulation protein AF [Clostridium coskatii]OAA92216.1 Stage III sporulation protein AF (Spore_III_AF) [Clostridium coskatii]OBR97235.1 stage III sporulation protein AF [Clostridium coskatii]
MLQSLKEWLINICTALFFITAIEMILPDNSMKKYCKFVLGLILITVFINPVVKIFNKDFDINQYTENAIESFEKGFNSKSQLNEFNDYKKKSMEDTIETFKMNLEAKCEKSLKEKHPDESYKVKIDANYDEQNNSVCIKNVNVQVKDGSVEKIKKVDINTKSTSVSNLDSGDDDKNVKLKTYLSQELNVSKNIIHVNS